MLYSQFKQPFTLQLTRVRFTRRFGKEFRIIKIESRQSRFTWERRDKGTHLQLEAAEKVFVLSLISGRLHSCYLSPDKPSFPFAHSKVHSPEPIHPSIQYQLLHNPTINEVRLFGFEQGCVDRMFILKLKTSFIKRDARTSLKNRQRVTLSEMVLRSLLLLLLDWCKIFYIPATN